MNTTRIMTVAVLIVASGLALTIHGRSPWVESASESRHPLEATRVPVICHWDLK